jgi:hypothetical protein
MRWVRFERDDRFDYGFSRAIQSCRFEATPSAFTSLRRIDWNCRRSDYRYLSFQGHSMRPA